MKIISQHDVPLGTYTGKVIGCSSYTRVKNNAREFTPHVLIEVNNTTFAVMGHIGIPTNRTDIIDNYFSSLDDGNADMNKLNSLSFSDKVRWSFFRDVIVTIGITPGGVKHISEFNQYNSFLGFGIAFSNYDQIILYPYIFNKSYSRGGTNYWRTNCSTTWIREVELNNKQLISEFIKY